MKNNNYFPFERNQYFYGKMLTARDFETEQKYFNNKRRLLNRAILGTGVVCGLGVYQNDDASFSVETGMALDYMGREIVVPNPIIRKLQMVDGYDKLNDAEQAYLCLEYAQSDKEPVNNIGATDTDSEHYNKIEESYSLYLSTDEPDVETIFGAAGTNSVSTIYCAKGLRIIRIVPKLVLSGDELVMRFIILKGVDSQPVSFTYTFESEYFKLDGENTAVKISFVEDKNLNRDIFTFESVLKTAFVSETAVQLSKSKGKISVQMGDFTDNAEVGDIPEVYLCGTAENYDVMKNTRMSTLEKHTSGENTPIYLAKIDCLNIGTGYIIRHISPLPFEQRLSLNRGETQKIIQTTVAAADNSAAAPSTKSENFLKGVTTEVDTLEYWQKPQVSVRYSQKQKNLNFRFGIPSSEAYDYATSSGVVDIQISGAIRVNARFCSEDIPHNLGIGDVSISLSVEFMNKDERQLLFGNGEVFAGKNDGKAVPRIDSAALLNPDKGTFKIGLWLMDYVEGHSIRVRWFAYKPTRDTAAMRAKENVIVKITPDIQKLKPLDRVRFKATVEGSADKTVIWSVKDADGGNVDENGLYQAPSTLGTYEIVAQSNADTESRTSAFVIVEE